MDTGTNQLVALGAVVVIGTLFVKTLWYSEMQAGSLIQLSANQGSLEEQDLELYGSYVETAQAARSKSKNNPIGEPVDKITFYNCDSCLATNCPCDHWFNVGTTHSADQVNKREANRNRCYLNSCGAQCEVAFPYHEAHKHQCNLRALVQQR